MGFLGIFMGFPKDFIGISWGFPRDFNGDFNGDFKGISMKSQGDMAKNVRETNENIREYTGDMEFQGNIIWN
jgi:hypothetical protein